MPEIFRTRDVVVFHKGNARPLAIDAAMKSGGWAGGQGVKWTDSDTYEFQVTYNDGMFGAGFILWGSDEDSDRYISQVGAQQKYENAIVCAGSWVVSFRHFEKYTWASRDAGGPLVPLTYTPNQPLYWSLRGLITNEDEWTASGDPRAPNKNIVAIVVQAPSAKTSNFLTLETAM